MPTHAKPIEKRAPAGNGSSTLRVLAGGVALLALPSGVLWALWGQWQFGLTSIVMGGLFATFAARGLAGLRSVEAPIEQPAD